MICINDTHPAPKVTPTYRIRDEAKNAAIAVLGPLAIHEFDFVTYQLDDGRWDWDMPATERPLSAAVIKANGGKKFLAARAQSMASTPMAHVEAAKPVKLPVPPRRVPVQASGKPAGTPDGGAGGEQPPSDETPTLSGFAPACNGLDVAKPDDGLELPTFLRREPAPAKSGTYDELKSACALRSEPVAKPVGKPPVSRKVVAKGKTAAPAAKRASKAPTKTAVASVGKTNIGTVARTAILKGKSNEEALAAVMKAFPACSSNAGCMAWYRNKLKKEGYLKQDGTPSAKGEAMLAGPTKAA